MSSPSLNCRWKKYGCGRKAINNHITCSNMCTFHGCKNGCKKRHAIGSDFCDQCNVADMITPKCVVCGQDGFLHQNNGYEESFWRFPCHDGS
jgi:hypothetical protein